MLVITITLVLWFCALGAISSHSNLYHLSTLPYFRVLPDTDKIISWNGEVGGGIWNGAREAFRRPTGSRGPGGTSGLRPRKATTKILFC